VVRLGKGCFDDAMRWIQGVLMSTFSDDLDSGDWEPLMGVPDDDDILAASLRDELQEKENKIEELLKINQMLLTEIENVRRRLNDQFKTALVNRRLDVLKSLLEVGVSPDTLRANDRTGLMRAAEFDDTELALLLLSYDAWPSAEDVDGDTALAIALRKKHVCVASLLARRILYNQLIRFHEEGDHIDESFMIWMLESLIIYGFSDLFIRALQLGFVPFVKNDVNTEWQKSLMDASIDFDSMIALAQEYGRPEIEKAIIQWHYEKIMFDRTDIIKKGQWSTYMSMFEESLSADQKQWIPNILEGNNSVIDTFLFVPLAGDIPENRPNASDDLEEGNNEYRNEDEGCPF
jgi:ankyrin repeat protein